MLIYNGRTVFAVLTHCYPGIEEDNVVAERPKIAQISVLGDESRNEVRPDRRVGSGAVAMITSCPGDQITNTSP